MDTRPNILIFMPDQLRADAVGCWGNAAASTPNIDALAARGTLFRQAFSQHSVCSPSRASIFTGWYPHVAGHRTLTHLLQPHEPNLLKLMRDGGYNVAWAGLRGDTFAPGVIEVSTDFHGFIEEPEGRRFAPPPTDGSKWEGAFYRGRREVDGVAMDLDEATVQTAEAWLKQAPEQPWILFVALVFPHLPFEVEEPWFSLHSRENMTKPSPPVHEDKPMYMRLLHERYGLDRLSTADWAEVAATYYGMVSRVDEQLGRLVDGVNRAGHAENTATVFFTDHGEYLGDHGLVEKWPSGLSDCLLRNPLIIDAPGFPGGQECNALVEMVDFLPTVLELGEIEAAHTHFGRSLIPLLEDVGAPHRDAAFSEGGFLVEEEHLLERGAPPYHIKGDIQHELPESVGKAISVRTDRWTYIHRLYEGNELYNRVNDPGELVNLSGTPDVATIERDLQDRVMEWMLATSDVIPWSPDPRFEPEMAKFRRRRP